MLARALGRRKRGRRGLAAITASATRWCGSHDAGAGAAHGGAAADADAVVDRVTSTRRTLARRIEHCWQTRAIRPRSSCTAPRSRATSRRATACRRSSTSATWIRRSGCEYAQYKPFPLVARLRRSRDASSSARKRGSRAASTCAPRRRAPSGRRSRATAPASATDWFPNGVDADYFAPSDAPYDADRIVFVGRMDYYPNQECMIDFCADVLPPARSAASRRATDDRRRRSVAGDAAARRAARA